MRNQTFTHIFKCVFLAALLACIFPPNPASAETPPSDWQLTGFGRGGALIKDLTADYESGTWNLKTGRSRSAIICQSLNGDISVVMKLTAASGDTRSHIGIMMWSSLAPNAGKAGLVLNPQGQKIYFSWDEASDRGQFYSSYIQAEGIGFPVWLKLTRSGSYFLAAYSKDGTDWRPLGVPIKTFWAGKRPDIYAGAYADGACEARFTDLQIRPAPKLVLPAALPDGWSRQINGEPEFAGQATLTDGEWTLAGASTRGRGGYHNVTVLKPVPEKVQLTTKIHTANLSDPQSSGGLLLSAHGMDAGILVYPAGGKLLVFTRRSSDGRLVHYRSLPVPSALMGQAEAYLSLALLDGKVAAYYGSDTNDWTQVGDIMTVNEMAADVSGGMELSSASGARSLASVSFEDFQAQPITLLPGQTPPPAPVKPAPATVVSTPKPSPEPTHAPAATARPMPVRHVNAAPPHLLWGRIITALAILGLILLFIGSLFLIKPFNRLVYLRNRARKAWAQIDVQLKRRHDLILNFVETVKGYAKHESSTLESVTQARAAAATANTVEEHSQAEAALNAKMRSLYAVVEAYPDLKANQNFLSLQSNLRETEDKLANSRIEYNEEVLTYNTKVQSFPTNLIARIFRFKERDFFEVKEAGQREAPKAAM